MSFEKLAKIMQAIKQNALENRGVILKLQEFDVAIDISVIVNEFIEEFCITEICSEGMKSNN